MTDRERLIELAKQTVADHQAGYAAPSSLKLARAILAELDPQPRELWDGKPFVGRDGGVWMACRNKCEARRLAVYGSTRAIATRRYNAAAEAIERSDKEAADGA